jgi:tryptophan synthase beta chain
MTQKNGWFGEFGGQFVGETLMPALNALEAEFNAAIKDKKFKADLAALNRDFVGRPSLLYEATRLTRSLGGAKIFLKREDLNHTGSHKINHCVGQALLCKRMKKKRMIAETGAGQHGVATATVAALFGFDCVVYMGEADVERQALNVFRMKLLGAEVRPVTSGSRTLKDALNEALRDWVSNVEDTYYCLGSVTGPHPYPLIVKTFQSIVGEEAKRQLKKAPNVVIGCVGGGSNALGLFAPFIKDKKVRLIGAEAAGQGLLSGEHSASLCAGDVGILHGSRTLVLQSEDGQVAEAHSVAPGLDYPGVGPEHAFLKTSGRAEYVGITDTQAIDAIERLAKDEGILCALESAHAVAHAIALAPTLPKSHTILVNLSGRGDKDMPTLMTRWSRAEKPFQAPQPHRPAAKTITPIADAHAKSRLNGMFERLGKRKALGVYLTVGDPSLVVSEAAAEAAVRGGADFLELGVPFSDPSADGPSIQKAMQRAIAAGTQMNDVLAMAARLRSKLPETPIILFGYANPFLRALQRGDLARCAADGMLVVDAPPDHDHDFDGAHLPRIRLLGPNATPARRTVIGKSAEGFVYLVAFAGVTGTRTRERDVEAMKKNVAAMRKVSRVPICVGFGVRSADDARALGPVADGIIAGSVFIDVMRESKDPARAVEEKTRELRAGLDA